MIKIFRNRVRPSLTRKSLSEFQLIGAVFGVVLFFILFLLSQNSSAKAMSTEQLRVLPRASTEVLTFSKLRSVALDKDCSDYGIREAADRSLTIDGRDDPYGLDGDDDGKACENLPLGLGWFLVPAIAVAFLLGQSKDDEVSELILAVVVTASFGFFIFQVFATWLPDSSPPITYSMLGGISSYLGNTTKSQSLKIFKNRN